MIWATTVANVMEPETTPAASAIAITKQMPKANVLLHVEFTLKGAQVRGTRGADYPTARGRVIMSGPIRIQDILGLIDADLTARVLRFFDLRTCWLLYDVSLDVLTIIQLTSYSDFPNLITLHPLFVWS